jgi:hypothetical protein
VPAFEKGDTHANTIFKKEGTLTPEEMKEKAIELMLKRFH